MGLNDLSSGKSSVACLRIMAVMRVFGAVRATCSVLAWVNELMVDTDTDTHKKCVYTQT